MGVLDFIERWVVPERRVGQSLGAEAKGFCNSLIKCRFSSHADVNTQEVRAGQATQGHGSQRQS